MEPQRGERVTCARVITPAGLSCPPPCRPLIACPPIALQAAPHGVAGQGGGPQAHQPAQPEVSRGLAGLSCSLLGSLLAAWQGACIELLYPSRTAAAGTCCCRLTSFLLPALPLICCYPRPLVPRLQEGEQR